MAQNWLRHRVDAQDGQAVIRKIVVCPAHDNTATTQDANTAPKPRPGSETTWSSRESRNAGLVQSLGDRLRR